MQKRERAACAIGLVVFAVGIVILLVSFFIAYKLFTSPAAGIAAVPGGANGASAAANLGRSALFVLIRIGALLVMVTVGSAVAKRGVQMYFASDRVPRLDE
jgi:hypothetical protein